ncbi:MAG: prolipoprotein diacylglyceryl transferase [Cyanobacteria bacterium P01_C01_bin.89]
MDLVSLIQSVSPGGIFPGLTSSGIPGLLNFLGVFLGDQGALGRSPLAVDLLGEFTSPGPIFFEAGPVTVRWYGFLIASALLLAVFLSQYLARRQGVNPEVMGDVAIWLVVGAIPCARLYYVLFTWDNYGGDISRMIAIWEGGIAIHGAIIGGTIGALLFAKLNKFSFWKMADLVAPSLILGQAIGRWGNFFNSEAFGGPTDLPWKLFIPRDRRPFGYFQTEYFHPTFLYESLWNLMIFAALMWIFFRSLRGLWPRVRPGALFCVYAIGYSFGRLWIEGLRTDSLMFGEVRVAQLISILGVSLGTLGLWWLYGKRRSLPDVSTYLPPLKPEGKPVASNSDS